MFLKNRLFPSTVVPPEGIQATVMMKVVVVVVVGVMVMVMVGVGVRVKVGVGVRVKVRFMANLKVRIEVKDAGVKVEVKGLHKAAACRSKASHNPDFIRG